MSVIDLDMHLPRALAWRKANTFPLLAVLLATYSTCQTCELSIKVDRVGFCRDWLPAYPKRWPISSSDTQGCIRNEKAAGRERGTDPQRQLDGGSVLPMHLDAMPATRRVSGHGHPDFSKEASGELRAVA